MAFLNETETYEAGIYQFDITDPVVGGPDGVDNLPSKQLANRTKWLKAKIDSILSMSFIHTAIEENPGGTDEFGYWDSFAQTLRRVSLTNLIATFRTTLDTVYAVLASPAFTGTPTAPTAAAGTNTTQIANTAFAMGACIGSSSQTWQTVTRSKATTYTNTTGRPIFLNIQYTSGSGTIAITIDGIVTTQSGGSSGTFSVGAIIPQGRSYSFDGIPSIITVVELR